MIYALQLSHSRNRERYKLIWDRSMSPKRQGWVTQHYLCSDHLRSLFARSPGPLIIIRVVKLCLLWIFFGFNQIWISHHISDGEIGSFHEPFQSFRKSLCQKGSTSNYHASKNNCILNYTRCIHCLVSNFKLRFSDSYLIRNTCL